MVLRKSIVVFLSVFYFSIILSNCYAQKRHLELRNISTNKVKKIKEKKKITVHTKDFKIKGPLKILDKQTIQIKGKKIKIDDIIKIENKSILAKVISAITLPLGAIFLIAGSGGTVFSTVFFPTGIVFTSLGLISMLTKKKYEMDNYQFNIIYD